MMTNETAILLLGHGSLAAEANESMYRVAEALRECGDYHHVGCAFLELNQPSIPEGLDLCREAGAGQIIIIPYFLHLGRHVQRDLPRIINKWQEANPQIKITLGEHLGFSQHLVALVRERIAGTQAD